MHHSRYIRHVSVYATFGAMFSRISKQLIAQNELNIET
jgi:hypothetical protein